MKAPSFATFGNFIRNELTDSIEQIFLDVNAYIFQQDHVAVSYTHLSGNGYKADAYTADNTGNGGRRTGH